MQILILSPNPHQHTQGKNESPMVTDASGTVKIRSSIVLEEQVNSLSTNRILSKIEDTTKAAKVESPWKAVGRTLQNRSNTLRSKMSTKTLAEITERARENLKNLKVRKEKQNNTVGPFL